MLALVKLSVPEIADAKPDAVSPVAANPCRGRLGAEATVAAETSNGDIRFAGSLDKGKHTLTTSNGSIELVLPAAGPFQFAASTSNGTVTNEIPGLRASRGKPGSNRLAGLVGSGSTADIDVKLETNNGSITLKPAH